MNSTELAETEESRKRQRAGRSGSPADLNRGLSEDQVDMDRLDTPTHALTDDSPVFTPLDMPLEPLSSPCEVHGDLLPPLEPVVPDSTFFDLNAAMPPIKRGASLMDVPYSSPWLSMSQHQDHHHREYSRLDPIPAADANKFLEVIWAADEP